MNRIELWRGKLKEKRSHLCKRHKEHLPRGNNLHSSIWKILNKIRTMKERTAKSM